MRLEIGRKAWEWSGRNVDRLQRSAVSRHAKAPVRFADLDASLAKHSQSSGEQIGASTIKVDIAAGRANRHGIGAGLDPVRQHSVGCSFKAVHAVDDDGRGACALDSLPPILPRQLATSATSGFAGRILQNGLALRQCGRHHDVMRCATETFGNFTTPPCNPLALSRQHNRRRDRFRRRAPVTTKGADRRAFFCAAWRNRRAARRAPHGSAARSECQAPRSWRACGAPVRPSICTSWRYRRSASKSISTAVMLSRKRRKGLQGGVVKFPKVSVGATHNVMMAGHVGGRRDRFENAACEPEVADVASCLNKMGAKIEGAGTPTIVIHGVDCLEGATHPCFPTASRPAPMPWRLGRPAAMSISMVRARICSTRRWTVLREAGIYIERDEPWPSGHDKRRFAEARQRCDRSFPRLPDDLQAQLMALMCRADGVSQIRETIFENRFMHVQELARLGADITVSGDMATVRGVLPCAARRSWRPICAYRFPSLSQGSWRKATRLCIAFITSIAALSDWKRNLGLAERRLNAFIHMTNRILFDLRHEACSMRPGTPEPLKLVALDQDDLKTPFRLFARCRVANVRYGLCAFRAPVCGEPESL